MDGFDIDELKIYFGDSIHIANGIDILSPSIGQIVDFGERNYFSMVQSITTTPSSMKYQLSTMNLDWEKVTDFQLFIMLAPTIPIDKSCIILGDLNLQMLKPYAMKDSEEIVLSNEDHSITINEVMYEAMMAYLRKMHGFKKQVDKAGNESTHKMLIEIDRQDMNKNKDKPYKSFLLPLVSSLQGRQGYTKNYIRDMGVFEFFNQINRLNIIAQADAALNGMYSGFCDTSKMDKSILDWTREITEEKTKPNTVLKQGAN